MAHHVTQRGVRSMPIFADDEGREECLSLLRQEGRCAGLRVLPWRLMGNHVHFAVVPICRGRRGVVAGVSARRTGGGAGSTPSHAHRPAAGVGEVSEQRGTSQPPAPSPPAARPTPEERDKVKGEITILIL